MTFLGHKDGQTRKCIQAGLEDPYLVATEEQRHLVLVELVSWHSLLLLGLVGVMRHQLPVELCLLGVEHLVRCGASLTIGDILRSCLSVSKGSLTTTHIQVETTLKNVQPANDWW